MFDLHKRGYFHRDLKPLNVVVSGWSAEKLRGTLVDWASASHKDRGMCTFSWVQLSLTVYMGFAAYHVDDYGFAVKIVVYAHTCAGLLH